MAVTKGYKKVTTGVCLSEPVLKALNLLASKHSRSKSHIVETLLREDLDFIIAFEEVMKEFEKEEE